MPLLFHFHQEIVDPRAEDPVGEHRRDRHDDAEGGGIERNRDALRQLLRIGPALLGRKDVDHADHRSQQAEQRCDRTDGAEKGEVAGKLVRDMAARDFHCPDGDVAPLVDAAQAGGEEKSERGVRLQLFDHLGMDLAARMQVQHVREQVVRKHAQAAQGDRALDDERQCNDRSSDQGPDGPADGLNDGEHEGIPVDNFVEKQPNSGTDMAAPGVRILRTNAIEK